MTVGALQDKKDSLASQLFRDWNSRLVPVVSESPEPPILQKMFFHIPHIPYYKYPYTHKM